MASLNPVALLLKSNSCPSRLDMRDDQDDCMKEPPRNTFCALNSGPMGLTRVLWEK